MVAQNLSCGDVEQAVIFNQMFALSSFSGAGAPKMTMLNIIIVDLKTNFATPPATKHRAYNENSLLIAFKNVDIFQIPGFLVEVQTIA